MWPLFHLGSLLTIQWVLLETRAKYVNNGSLPQFTSKISNVSVPIGRDALFTCNVKNLGTFKVGWVKADSKAIQAIHDAIITHNPRVTVSGDLFTTFNLHIASVSEDDRGLYMCQINTVPMKSQIASLDVMVPPDITLSSPDQELKQGDTATLECRSKGYPTPTISWRREVDRPIKAKDRSGLIKKVRRFQGTTLTIPRVTPADMGAYLCIATNNVPPARSKRVFLYVQFPPTVSSGDGSLVGFSHGTDVLLRCNVSAYPRPIIYWNNTDGIVFAYNKKYELTEVVLSPLEMSSTLLIKGATVADAGKFECVATNSIGSSHCVIRTYMVAPPPPPPSSSSAASSTVAVYSQEKQHSNEHDEVSDWTLADNHIGGSKKDEETKGQKRKWKHKPKNNSSNSEQQQQQKNYYYSKAFRGEARLGITFLLAFLLGR